MTPYGPFQPDPFWDSLADKNVTNAFLHGNEEYFPNLWECVYCECCSCHSKIWNFWGKTPAKDPATDRRIYDSGDTKSNITQKLLGKLQLPLSCSSSDMSRTK